MPETVIAGPVGDRLGAVISSARFSDGTNVRELLLKERVVLVRDFDGLVATQLAVTSAFGPAVAVERHWHGLSGLVQVRYEDDAQSNPYNEVWHTDTSWAEIPAQVTLLFAQQAAPNAVATELADVVAGFNALPDHEQAELAQLRIHHHVSAARQQHGFEAAGEPRQNAARRVPSWRHNLRVRRAAWRHARTFGRAIPTRLLTPIPHPGVAHPAICHDAVGRRYPLLGEHAWLIEGSTPMESATRLSALTRKVAVGLIRHHWQPGDLLIFDNRSLLHRRAPGAERLPGERVLRRTLAWLGCR